jgi:hypothetical protein
MCSLTDFIETSLGRCGGLVSTATVTGQGASLVDASVRGGDFWWPKTGTSGGHQRGHQLAKNGDFLMATDNLHDDGGFLPHKMLHNSNRLPSSARLPRLGHPWSDRRVPSGTAQSACPNRIHTAECEECAEGLPFPESAEV